jgi:hypothetical protein
MRVALEPRAYIPQRRSAFAPEQAGEVIVVALRELRRPRVWPKSFPRVARPRGELIRERRDARRRVEVSGLRLIRTGFGLHSRWQSGSGARTCIARLRFVRIGTLDDPAALSPDVHI